MPKLFVTLRLGWVVLISTWFALLAPAEASRQLVLGAALGAVCSAAPHAGGDASSPASDEGSLPALVHHKHCNACLVHVDMALVSALPVLPAVQAVSHGAQRWPALAWPAQRVAWAHLPSRAPPFFLV